MRVWQWDEVEALLWEEKEMSGQRSKQKGAQFERNVCSALSLWITDGARDDVFWRSSMSGGRSVESAVGDISAVAEAGFSLTNRFVIECKHYNEEILSPLIFGNYSLVSKWWPKLLDEARGFKRLPMLIVKENRRPTMVLVSGATARSIVGHWSSLWTGGKMPCLVFMMQFDTLLRLDEFKRFVRGNNVTPTCNQ